MPGLWTIFTASNMRQKPYIMCCVFAAAYTTPEAEMLEKWGRSILSSPMLCLVIDIYSLRINPVNFQ